MNSKTVEKRLYSGFSRNQMAAEYRGVRAPSREDAKKSSDLIKKEWAATWASLIRPGLVPEPKIKSWGRGEAAFDLPTLPLAVKH